MVRPRAKSRSVRRTKGGSWYRTLFSKRKRAQQVPVILARTEDMGDVYDSLDDRHAAYLTSRLLR